MPIPLTTNSAVGICSYASVSLGGNPFNDFQQDTDVAVAASNTYAQARDELLRAHPWNSCIKRASLVPDTDTPPFGYPYQFTLPVDCLRVDAVYSTGGCPWTEYALEGRKILTNLNGIGLRYVYRNEVESSWDPSLVRLMILRMRWVLAYTITRDPAMETLTAQEYAQELRQYKAANGQENPAQELTGDAFLSARW
jgi:hypothetical protein